MYVTASVISLEIFESVTILIYQLWQHLENISGFLYAPLLHEVKIGISIALQYALDVKGRDTSIELSNYTTIFSLVSLLFSIPI